MRSSLSSSHRRRWTAWYKAHHSDRPSKTGGYFRRRGICGYVAIRNARTPTNGIWAILENATTISTLVLCAHKTETATNALAALQRVSGSIEEMQLILPSWNDKGRWVVWDQAVYEVLSTKPRRYPNLHSLKMVFPTSSTSLEGEEEEDTIYVDLTNRLPSTRDWCATHRIQFGSLRDDRKPACFSLLYRRN